MTEPRVTVIVPIYRVEEYLPACLDSILAQTMQECELILVDDGSPDNCGAICDEYAARDRRVRVIHQDNAGVSAARNAGLDAARGAYVSFIDGDDRISPRFLECLLTPETDIAQCGVASVSEKLAEAAVFEIVPAREMSLRMYGNDCLPYVVVCNKLWRRDILKGLRFPVGSRYEDEAFIWKGYEAAGSIAVTDALLYDYRQRDGSFTNQRFTPQRLDAAKALQERAEHYKAIGDEELFTLTQAALCHQLRGYMPDIRRALPQEAGRYHALMRQCYRDVMRSRSCGITKRLGLSLQMVSPMLYRTLKQYNAKRIMG